LKDLFMTVTPFAPAAKLLPASIPFRFFGAALVFHLLAWTALAAVAGDVAGFAGGLGPVLGILHLMTLGVLTATVFGAAFQLLPVAVRADLPALWPCRLAGWLLLPGAPVLAWGMANADPLLTGIAGTAVAAALLVFGLTIGAALRRADHKAAGVRMAAYHVWAALAALLLLAGFGLALLGDFTHGWLGDHRMITVIHLAVACYGFLGLLAVGFSHLLVPMFALAPAVPERPAYAALGLALTGLMFTLAGLFAPAALCGLAASGLHLVNMVRAFRARIRRNLGPSFLLVRLSWAMLPVSLAVGLLLSLGLLPAWMEPLFVVLLVVGWLLSLVLGMLQRILPFLATLHAARGARRMPRSTELTSPVLARLQAAGHALALLGLTVGVVFDRADLIRAGALIGAAGAAILILFALDIWLRVRDLPPAQPIPLNKELAS
jgi:hypothetical protein